MAGFAQLPHDILKAVLHLLLSPSAIVRATICCKPWQGCVTPASERFWRSVYASAGLHVAALPRKVPPPTTPDSDEIDWYSACCYQSRVLHNIRANRYHIRILDVAPFDYGYNLTNFVVSTGLTKIAITLVNDYKMPDVDMDIDYPDDAQYCKVLSIETGQLEAKKAKLPNNELIRMNGDFVVADTINDPQASMVYKGCDLRDWKSLPPEFEMQPLTGQLDLRTTGSTNYTWGFGGKVLSVGRTPGFTLFDLAERRLIATFNADHLTKDNITWLHVHQDKCFYTRHTPGAEESLLNYFVLPKETLPAPGEVGIVRNCGPHLPKHHITVKFCGDCLVAAPQERLIEVYNFLTRIRIESWEGENGHESFFLSESFVFTAGTSVHIFQRGQPQLVLLLEVRLTEPIRALHGFDDGRFVAQTKSMVLLYDFGMMGIEPTKPVQAVVWKEGTMGEAQIDSDHLLADVAAVLGVSTLPLRSFFAPIPGEADSETKLVLVTLAAAKEAENAPLVDAFWRSTFSPKAYASISTEERKASTVVPTNPMVVLKRRQETFLDFPCPTGDERTVLEQALASWLQ